MPSCSCARHSGALGSPTTPSLSPKPPKPHALRLNLTHSHPQTLPTSVRPFIDFEVADIVRAASFEARREFRVSRKRQANQWEFQNENVRSGDCRPSECFFFFYPLQVAKINQLLLCEGSLMWCDCSAPWPRWFSSGTWYLNPVECHQGQQGLVSWPKHT